MSTEKWKLEKDLCRCCHSEGKFTNLSEPCHNLGQEEIYVDMIRDCFNIDIAPVPGMLCTMTYTICESCVKRVRDAFNFRKQVQTCEERFKDMYRRDFIKVAADTIIAKVKVKEEFPDSYQDDIKDDFSADEDGHNDGFDDALDTKFHDDEDSNDTLDVIKQKPKKQVRGKPKKSVKKTAKKKSKEDSEKTAGEEPKKRGHTVKETDAYYNLKDEDDGTKKFACSACARNYQTLASVVQHYRHVHLHLRPKLRSCYYCEIKVPGHARAFHLEKEHGIPAPTCGACGKKFAYPFQVLRHQKHDHMGEKKFSCDLCGMRFTSQANLAQHYVKHSAVRKHKCQQCDKAFKWKKNLKTHIMMHMNDKRHVCPVCREAFVQQTSLKYHITRRHPEIV